jgi:hypothetical protein
VPALLLSVEWTEDAADLVDDLADLDEKNDMVDEWMGGVVERVIFNPKLGGKDT